MSPRRVPGSLQRAVAAGSAEFIEIVITGDEAVELRVDRCTTGLGMAAQLGRLGLLCDACDPGAPVADRV